ncbi:MAG: hypothetical protein QM774_08990 [Gordonia sp. (in: high G+C Gram-positive bacteria)]|uniref:hypothetical protein n=1 Tax=Gordonia sp. (in: high G+C Gram-positive bacteria) TaxID=84139 RepID=UPI0039E6FC7B
MNQYPYGYAPAPAFALAPVTPYDVPHLRKLDTVLCAVQLAIQVVLGTVVSAILPFGSAGAGHSCRLDHPVCDVTWSHVAVVVLPVSVVVLAAVAIIGGLDRRRHRQLARPVLTWTCVAQTVLITVCSTLALTGVYPA